MSELIKFIAPNNVEVQKILVDSDDNREHIVERESYGKERLDNEMKVVEAEIDKWTNLDVKKYVADKLKEAVAKKAKLDEIKEKLEEEARKVEVKKELTEVIKKEKRL